MKIVVDRTRCQGVGMCESFAPHIFEVGDDGEVELHTETVPAGEQDVVEQAVEGCPTMALSVED